MNVGSTYLWSPKPMMCKDKVVRQVFAVGRTGRGFSEVHYYERVSGNTDPVTVRIIEDLGNNTYTVDYVAGADEPMHRINTKPYVRKDGTFRTIDDHFVQPIKKLPGGVVTEQYFWISTNGQPSYMDQYYSQYIQAGLIQPGQLYFIGTIVADPDHLKMVN